MKKQNNIPKALVLSKTGTGLATIRGLAAGGVKVIAAIFKKEEPVRYSSCCELIDLCHIRASNDLLDWLIDYGKQQTSQLILFPTSDEHALLLAENRQLLRPHYIFWNNSHDALLQIINKNQLYAVAKEADVPIIPSISEPDKEQLSVWVPENNAPYFLKPFYEGNKHSSLNQKNLILV
ncbi:MAG: hypothetical protein H6937_04105 [Burkholderiales bacterium]|nr:hypothetical protein [Burkholderiales bacterium]MDR4516104.1 hypothetical protein [Nitrosomonas sp.]